MVEATRRHAVSTLTLRTQESALERYSVPRHGHHHDGPNIGDGRGKHGQRRNFARGETGTSDGGAVEETPTPTPEEEARAAHHKIVR